MDDNLSRAWARGFLAAMQGGEIVPLIVTVTDFSNGRPQEHSTIRAKLDAELIAHGKRNCHSVANTIFPAALWTPGASRVQLYKRYEKILPRLRRYPANRNGLYFERMVSHGPTRVNQLEHIIVTRKGGNRRRSALYAAIVDPSRDHTHQRQRGFPCLQQVAFTPEGAHGLAVTGFYNTQYLFERAYGNYVGLCRLGEFVAHELGLALSRMTCVAAVAKQEMKKTSIQSFVTDIQQMISSEQDEDA